MKNTATSIRAIFVLFFLCLITNKLASQNTPFWSNNGNNVNANDKLGSTNSAPLTFVTSNTQRMQISAAGNVGIGTTPSAFYRLDVNGDANFSGTVHAFGLVLATKAQIDTVRVTNIMSLGNNFNFTGGALNEMYTYNGDIRLQSLPGYNGNVVMGAGTNGNVGIGNYSPAYKLDVNGTTRLAGTTYVQRIDPLPGDSVVRFGDSTIVVSPTRNGIFSSSSSPFKGLSLGFATYNSALNFYSYKTSAYGLHSIAIGYKVATSGSADNAVVIGCGPLINNTTLTNTTPNSLMVAFKSNIPTFFVGPATSETSVGNVGVGTGSPIAAFQVGDSYKSFSAGPVVGNQGNDFSISYVGMNAAYDAGSMWNFQSDFSHNGGVVMESTINGNLNIYAVNSNGSPGVAQVIDDATLRNSRVMQITSKGRVVIGKELDPNASQYNDDFTHLTVDGRIVCKDLVVNINGFFPDYVFDPNYKLMSMDSLGQYVAINKHLPATPPAAQLEQNGASLSELCTTQQKQIEELTLYILQLNQRLEAIEAQQNSSK